MSKTNRFDTFQVGDAIRWFNWRKPISLGIVIEKTNQYLRVKWDDTSKVIEYSEFHVNEKWEDGDYEIDETSVVERLLKEYDS
jgi:hypothetical protein